MTDPKMNEQLEYAAFLHNPWAYPSKKEKAAVCCFTRKQRFIEGYDVNENIYNILNNYFGNLSLLSKTGLRKVFNLLKEEVINNKLIGLILYGTNINEQHNRLFGFYTTVQNSKIKLTVKSICIYLIKDYIGRKNVETLCEETPNFNIYYKCDEN